MRYEITMVIRSTEDADDESLKDLKSDILMAISDCDLFGTVTIQKLSGLKYKIVTNVESTEDEYFGTYQAEDLKDSIESALYNYNCYEQIGETKVRNLDPDSNDFDEEEDDE